MRLLISFKGNFSCGLVVDSCPSVANVDQLDADSDEGSDAFPSDETETDDSDLDGIGDNSDSSPNGGYGCRLFDDGTFACG